MITVTFWLLTLFTCAFAVGFGGRDGRLFSVLLLASVLLTIPAWMAGSWHATQFWLLIVDSLFFVGLFWLMLNSASYWPIWAAASQLITVITHVVTLLLQNFSDRIYEGLSTIWVIPLLLFTIIGVELDRKSLHDRVYPA
ncbi:hypothetical protein J3E64_000549 [Sphingobium sp. OAS761]|uniref:hypothetical protein n=1 Tax=Sphingobium sp. OAS761 TaxID=2817901 RepID=UPI00209E2FAA|nr:hypothetical protein [Sphingobium sp. OAS761]MCP1468878.1 hypothetical protein [Sphingobium sp. OAS761]